MIVEEMLVERDCGEASEMRVTCQRVNKHGIRLNYD